MANWQNVTASEDLVEMIQSEVAAAFKEATGREMPEGFGNWSFQKRRGEYSFGIEMDAAEKALSGTKRSGNIPVADAEMNTAIREWVEYITAGDGALGDVPLVIREAVERGLRPTSLRPPAKAKQPDSLRPPAKGKGEKLPASKPDHVSKAAQMAALKRELVKKMGGR